MPVELQGFFRTADGAHTAANAFLRIHDGSPGFLIQRQGIQHAAVHTLPAFDTVIACLGKKT